MNEGQVITVSGVSVTNMPADEAVTYEWTVTDFQSIGFATSNLVDANALTVSFTAPMVTQDRRVALNLTVTDAAGGVAMATVANNLGVFVDIRNVVNPPPMIVVTGTNNSRSTNEGQRFVMSDTSVTNEPVDEAVTYEWTVLVAAGTGLTTADLTDEDTLTVSFTAPMVSANANVGLQLMATDANGGTVVSVIAVPIINVPTTTAPLTLTPSNNQAVTSGTAVAFGIELPSGHGLQLPEFGPLLIAATATVTSPPAHTSLAVNIDNSRIANFIAPVVTTATPIVITVTTAAASNNVIYTGTITYTVSPAPVVVPVPPTVRVNAPRNVRPGATVLVTATVTDPDTAAADLRYAWSVTRNGAAFATVGGRTGNTVTFTAPAVSDTAGLNRLRVALTVTGGSPNPVAAETVEIAVTAAPPNINARNHEAILPETARAIAGNLADNIAARVGAGRGVWGGVGVSNVGGGSVSATTAEFDGSLTGINIGVDRKFGDKIGGVALSKVSGSFDVTGDAEDYEVDALLISPYLAWRSGGRSYWGFAGVGSGETTQGGITEDLSITSLGGGFDGAQVFGFGLGFDASHSNATGGETDVSATRIRGTADLVGGTSGTVTHNGHAALRGDFGDGDTGLGVEIGGNVSRVTDRLTLTARAKLLLFHTGDSSEWGISGDIRYRTGADGQGASFHLTPTIGDSAKADAALNFGIPTTHGLVTPFTAMTVGNDNVHRMGVNWHTPHGLLFGLTTDKNQTVLKFGL